MSISQVLPTMSLLSHTEKTGDLTVAARKDIEKKITRKRNYYLPKQKRCYNFREEIPDQACG